MSKRAGTYNLVNDYSKTADDGYLSSTPFWALAIIRLGLPLSFSRRLNASVTRDVTAGALLRADQPLLITDDCVALNIQNSKRSHTKTLSATLLQTDVNYLSELLTGDHVMAWMMNSEEDFNRIVQAIKDGKPANGFNDGLKFVGRIHDISKDISVDPGTGTKTSTYDLQCVGFAELDSCLFYDHSLASNDQISRDLGQWLARLGLDINALFESATRGGIPSNNINTIIPTLLDLIVGKGPKTGRDASPVVGTSAGDVSATPQTLSEPPYAYLIPISVGKLLGKNPSDASKPSKIMAYADILELLQGVQNYSNKATDSYQIFTPDLSSKSTPQRRVTTTSLLGTFLPLMPELTNRPLWQIFNQFLNPVINEMYTALRVNPEGSIVPTIVLRQIAFTTEAFQADASIPGATSNGATIPYTRFLDLPRWVIPDTAISRVHVGRSDATRTNMVHVYGASSALQNNVPVQYQLINNPPIRDDLDVMRSGMRPFMSTVDCFVNDQIGTVPGQWMRLIADRMIGSHLTLNGTISCLGIQSPIVEGDNLEFDGVVYHLESVQHSASIDFNGNKSWTTTLQLTNGMRSDVDIFDVSRPEQPIYPGIKKTDLTFYDPGLTLEQGLTTGGDSQQQDPEFDSKQNEVTRSEGASQLELSEEDGLKDLL